jgi:hypothetical protein
MACPWHEQGAAGTAFAALGPRFGEGNGTRVGGPRPPPGRGHDEETRQQMETAEQDGQRARNDLLRIDAEEPDLTGRRDQKVA